jgi:hypothetical protein
MVPEDVREYIKLFEAVLKPETGLFYSIQRKKDNSPHLHSRWKDYPFDGNWSLNTADFMGNENFVECFGTRKGKR